MKALISQIVEEELHSPIVASETHDQFVKRVAVICLDEITEAKAILPAGFTFDVLQEVEAEVTEVLRKKIYGFYNLDVYRQQQLRQRIL